MFNKNCINLLYENNSLLQYKKRKTLFSKLKISYVLVLVLMMILMIVEVSSKHYQNQSTAAIRTRRVKGYNKNLEIANITTNNSAIVAKSKPLKEVTRRNIKSTKHKDKTATIQPTKRMRADMQHQRRERQRQIQQQHHHPQAGETAYLVERATTNEDDADELQSVREQQQQQPIYGTWRTKAKRPQASLSSKMRSQLTTTSSANHTITNELNASTVAVAATPTTPAPVPAAQLTVSRNLENDYHVYERLPRRSATMTPLRSELHDQLPRPPRLTSRRPSFVVRRQYMETPINPSYIEFEQNPKPFHFPFDGPLPAEFKKAQPERTELNNIQEILQHLHLNGVGAAPAVARTPQLMMMPTGLHVAGSFKNFKSSGIANFFRNNKRNKKQVQLSLPLQLQPMAIPNPLPLQYYSNNYHSPPPHLYGAMAQPYQRVTMDQLYAFKPRSPNEINLLAMQQQLNAKRLKNKKHKKIVPPITNNALYGYNSSNNLLQQQSNQRPDHFVPYYPPQWLLMNATQKPQLKRIPFKVNLDIFPVLSPTKAAIPLRNPFIDYGGAAFQYPQALPQQQNFNAANFLRAPVTQQQQQEKQPQQQHHQQLIQQQSLQQQQSSNSQVIFPDQIPKYTQQQYLVNQEPHQRHPLNPQQNTFTPIDFDCIEPESNENEPSNSNQIMLHLNVFPKPRTTATPLPSTNPFYSNARNIVNEPNEATQPPPPPESYNLSRQTAYANDTVQSFYRKPQNRISRSDDNYATLVDFEHPIVAAELSQLPKPAALISNKFDTSAISSHYDHIETSNNFDPAPNNDQLPSEVRAGSSFRHPVEDLIQFQVDDAL